MWLFAGLLEFIPLVGPLVVAVGATMIVGFHSLNQAAMVLVFLGVLLVAQDYVIFPRLVRRGAFGQAPPISPPGTAIGSGAGGLILCE